MTIKMLEFQLFVVFYYKANIVNKEHRQLAVEAEATPIH